MPAANQSLIPSPQSRAAPTKEASRISGMFDAIAGRYDFLNHLLSAGLDKQWRRRAVDALQLTGHETVLDLCTGTADLALAAMTGGTGAKRVVGIDFSAAMLQIGKEKDVGSGASHPTRRTRRTRRRCRARPIDHARAWRCDTDTARGRLGRQDTIGFGIRNVERTWPRVPRNRAGPSPGRHARDPGVFIAALGDPATFLSLVFPRTFCRSSVA